MTGMEKLKKKIEEQQEVYAALKEGDTSLVCYEEYKNGEWGTDDANYTNRLCLAYYLLYDRIDDEDAVVYLFGEELKDRENNSFQGIGTTLQILTRLLKKYDGNHKYADLFQRAKNANFDCACGYDPENATVDDHFWNNSLLDGIYLAQEMGYKDVMGDLVDEWKGEVAEWTGDNRRTLINFNIFLGREEENEKLYHEQLAEALSQREGKEGDVIAGYRDIIQYDLRIKDYEKASYYCKTVIETTDYGQVKTRRLFGDILEACFEVTAKAPALGFDLWNWAKTELQKQPQSSWYGNLYTKAIAAATAAKDPYAETLKREYQKWRKACQI